MSIEFDKGDGDKQLINYKLFFITEYLIECFINKINFVLITTSNIWKAFEVEV